MLFFITLGIGALIVATNRMDRADSEIGRPIDLRALEAYLDAENERLDQEIEADFAELIAKINLPHPDWNRLKRRARSLDDDE